MGKEEQHNPEQRIGAPTPAHVEREHSIVSASGASRWLACPGSVAMSLKVPPAPTSEYAQEGTKAHELTEIMLRPLILTGDLENSLNFLTRQDYPEDMQEHIEGYVRRVWEAIQQTKPKKVLIEERLTLNAELGMFGTADVMWAYKHGINIVGVIKDLKYGAGVAVEVEGNPQLAYYACALDAVYGKGRGKPFDRIECSIDQPRVEHVDGPVRTMVLERKDIDEWTEKLVGGARHALQLVDAQLEYDDVLDGQLHTGKHCRWCPAKAVCPEFQQKTIERVGAQFTELVEAEQPDLTPAKLSGELTTEHDEKISRILAAKDDIKAFIASLEAYAMSRYQSGKPVKGWKVVVGPTRRTWAEQSTVALGLKEMGVNPWANKLRTITDVEKELKDKELKKGAIDHLTTKTKAKPILVSDCDPRPGLDAAQAAALLFEGASAIDE